MAFEPPRLGEYHEYYEQYISKANRHDFMSSFAGQPQELRDALGGLEPGEDSRLHEPYTWTLKQVLGHMIDCERIFSNRMLRIAVGDEAPIPGIDQNSYVASLDYESPTMDELLDEFELLRKANVLLVNRLPIEGWSRMGTASDNPVSAKANLFILAGHVVYHLDIIKRRVT
jgi:hypothetical protein